MLDWIARVKVPPCAKFGDFSSKGVGARGHKAEKRKRALRALLTPRGRSTYMARVSQTKVHLP